MVGRKIVVVEDEMIIAKAIQKSLERFGYLVPALASSGEEAVEKAEKLRPDLMLMDIRLRGSMDGVETAEKIRERFHIPVVYLTASSDQSTLSRMKATEPIGLLIKPFKEDDLHTVIELALYKHDIETKLRESEEWLSGTLTSIAAGVIATDAAGCVRLMNPASEILTGWKQAEVAGRRLDEVFHIIHEVTREKLQNPVIQVIREGGAVPQREEALLIRSDGTEIPIDRSAALIKHEDGNILGAVLIFHDITEQRRAQEELRESELRFRTMADTAPVMLWMSGTDALCNFFNKPWLDFTGRSMEMEKGNGWAEGVHAEDFLLVMDTFMNAFVARKNFRMEYRLRRADGEYRWILDTGVPRFTPAGVFEGFIGSCIDITERKEAEQTFFQVNHELREKIRNL